MLRSTQERVAIPALIPVLVIVLVTSTAVETFGQGRGNPGVQARSARVGQSLNNRTVTNRAFTNQGFTNQRFSVGTQGFANRQFGGFNRFGNRRIGGFNSFGLYGVSQFNTYGYYNSFGFGYPTFGTFTTFGPRIDRFTGNPFFQPSVRAGLRNQALATGRAYPLTAADAAIYNPYFANGLTPLAVQSVLGQQVLDSSVQGQSSGVRRPGR